MSAATRPERVIRPTTGWGFGNLRELVEYRDLVGLWIRRDVVSRYRQTLLGPLWHVVQPLTTTAIFVVVFSRVADISTSGAPPALFYLAGLLPWSYFASTVPVISSTLVTNAGLYSKVYFPRLCLPLATAVSQFVPMALQTAVFCAGLTAARTVLDADFPGPVRIGLTLLLPLLVVQLATLCIGLGLSVSAFTVRYRDLLHVLPFGIQSLLYLTPVIYPSSAVSGAARTALLLNPVAAPIEVTRAALLGSPVPPAWSVLVSVVVSVGLLFVGLLSFARSERTMVDLL